MKGIEFIVQNGKEEEICMVLPEELLNEAGIGASREIEVVCREGQIVITGHSILDYIPDDLLELYDSLGISRAVVEAVLEEDLFPKKNAVIRKV